MPLQGIPAPAALVTTVSWSTHVKEQRSHKDYLNKVKAGETKKQKIRIGWGEIAIARTLHKGWERESQWYPGLASSLPASVSAAYAGASRQSTEWKQGQHLLRQKSGSSFSWLWCFPAPYRMETEAEPHQSFGSRLQSFGSNLISPLPCDRWMQESFIGLWSLDLLQNS